MDLVLLWDKFSILQWELNQIGGLEQAKRNVFTNSISPAVRGPDGAATGQGRVPLGPLCARPHRHQRDPLQEPIRHIPGQVSNVTVVLARGCLGPPSPLKSDIRKCRYLRTKVLCKIQPFWKRDTRFYLLFVQCCFSGKAKLTNAVFFSNIWWFVIGYHKAQLCLVCLHKGWSMVEPQWIAGRGGVV